LQFYWSEFVLFGLQWARLDHLAYEGLEIVTAETDTQAALSMGRDAVNKPMGESGRTLSEHGFPEEDFSILKFCPKYVSLFEIYDEVQPWQKCVIFVEKDRSLATM
jgi:hypothetical protein